MTDTISFGLLCITLLSEAYSSAKRLRLVVARSRHLADNTKLKKQIKLLKINIFSMACVF